MAGERGAVRSKGPQVLHLYLVLLFLETHPRAINGDYVTGTQYSNIHRATGHGRELIM